MVPVLLLLLLCLVLAVAAAAAQALSPLSSGVFGEEREGGKENALFFTARELSDGPPRSEPGAARRRAEELPRAGEARLVVLFWRGRLGSERGREGERERQRTRILSL
jgi:hypothetical protein